MRSLPSHVAEKGSTRRTLDENEAIHVGPNTIRTTKTAYRLKSGNS